MATGGSGSRLERVKLGLLVASVCAAYAVLRLTLSTELRAAPWEQLLDLTAAKPFGLRVLVPLLSRTVMEWTGWSPALVFGLFEFASILALVLTLGSILRLWIPRQHSLLFALGFVLLLPFLYLMNFFLLPPVYYPYDTPAMVFLALGLWSVLTRRWALALVVVVVGTLNRETTFMIPLCAAVLLPLRRWSLGVAGALASMFAAYFLVKWGIESWMADLPAPTMRFYRMGELRAIRNLQWLASPVNWPVLISNLGFTPLLWIGVSRYIPSHLRRLRYPALVLFVMAFLVGNLYEARIFGELLLPLYIPIAVGITRWLREEPAEAPVHGASSGILRMADRFGVSLSIALIAVAVLVLFALSPAPGLAPAGSGVWEGCVFLGESGPVELSMPDGMDRVSLGGRPLLDRGSPHATIRLHAGFFGIRIEGRDFRGLRARSRTSDAPRTLDDDLRPMLQATDARCRNAGTRLWGVHLPFLD